LKRIRECQSGIHKYVTEERPRSSRLANISIISSAIAPALTAGPAAGGTTFAKTVQEGLGWDQSSSVWRLLCLAAVIVSIVSAISANMNKSNDSAARISAAEDCNAELEGLYAQLEMYDNFYVVNFFPSVTVCCVPSSSTQERDLSWDAVPITVSPSAFSPAAPRPGIGIGNFTSTKLFESEIGRLARSPRRVITVLPTGKVTLTSQMH
jgi:hypothetical protein